MYNEMTIAIATYNGAAYVEDALKSALSTGVRVIVSDDCSDDGTLAILENFDSRVDLIRQPRRLGISGQYQFLLEACETPQMLLLNQDDVLMPDVVTATPASKTELTILNGWVIDADGRRVRTIYRRPPFHATARGVYTGLSMESFIRTPSQVILPVALAREAGGFRIPGDPGQGAEDWMCWLRLAALGVRFRLRLRRAMCYRLHGGSYSASGTRFGASRNAVRNALPVRTRRDQRLHVAW